MNRISPELLDRLPPNDLDAERALLGSILLDPERIDDVAGKVRAEDLYGGANRLLFWHLLAMRDAGKRIDHRLLQARMQKSGDFEAAGGVAYLAELVEAVPVASHATHYAEIIRDKAGLRRIIEAATTALAEAYDPTADLTETIHRCEQKLFGILGDRAEEHIQSIGDVVRTLMMDLDQKRGVFGGGLDCGFSALNEQIGGLRPGELVILAARPKVGKTALALAIADNVGTDQKRGVYIASLEMSGTELAGRLICARARVNSHKYRSDFLNPDDRHKLVQATNEISSGGVLIDDTAGVRMTQIAATARRLKKKRGLALVIVDYLQLIAPDDARAPRVEQVAAITRRLKTLARELSTPVLCLAQLNRQTEVAADKRPQLWHLRESGSIEQDADVVVFLHRQSMYLKDPGDLRYQAEAIVAKNRNGPEGVVPLAWLSEFTRFDSVATHSGEYRTPYAQDEFPE